MLQGGNLCFAELKFSQRSRDFQSYWKADFKIYTLTDRSTTNTISSTEVYGKIHWMILDNFSIHLQGLIVGRNGFSQSVYDRDDRRRGFHFLEGYLKYKRNPSFEVVFGNIKQDFLQAPLLITDKTFPSLKETVHLNFFSNIKGRLVFQQAIPDNATENVRRATQIISTPLFLTSSLFLDKSLGFKQFKIQQNFTSFYFTNLSSAVADKGRLYGNSVNYSGSDSDFKFKFYGIYSSTKSRFSLTDVWIAELGFDFLHNFGAQDTFNQGERLYTSIYKNFQNILEIKITGEYFTNQSDSSVAYYNSELYGHNNRIGGGLRLESYFYKSGINLGMSYRYSQPIEKLRTTTGKGHYFLLYVGTNYVSI